MQQGVTASGSTAEAQSSHRWPSQAQPALEADLVGMECPSGSDDKDGPLDLHWTGHMSSMIPH